MEAERLVELQGKKEEERRNQRRREESFYFGERKTRVFLECVFQIFLFLLGYFRSGKALFYPHPPLPGDTVAPAEAKKMRCYSSASFPLPHLELIKF